jgi:hypothetical protein
LENITVRLAPGFDGRILRAISNANPTGGIRPHRIKHVTMPLLARNRKDTARVWNGESIFRKARWPSPLPENAGSVAVS